MNANTVFNRKQLNRLNKIKNPTLSKIIELSQEMNTDAQTIIEFYINRESKRKEATRILKEKYKDILTDHQFNKINSYNPMRIDDVTVLSSELGLNIETIIDFYKDKLDQLELNK